MSQPRRIPILVAVLTVVALGGVGASMAVLYRTAIEEQESRLLSMARSRARLIEAVARFDARQSPDYPGGPAEATLSQVHDAHARLEGFGRTGEFTLARRQGDRIAYLLRQRHAPGDSANTIPWSSRLAEPQRRALAGESGTMIGPDYRGEKVLAAYEPVAELDLGSVVKIDVAEIRRPFLRAGVLAGGVSLLLIVVGTFGVITIGRRYERDIRTRQRRWTAVARQLPSGAIHVFDRDLRWEFAGGEELHRAGLDPANLEGRRVTEILPDDVLEVVERERRRILEGEPVRFEVLFLGETYQISGAPLRESPSDPERVTGILALATNITALKEAEADVRESEERLKLALSAARQGLYDVDMPSGDVIVDEEYARLLGYEPGELDESEGGWLERLHPDDRERVERVYRDYLEGKREDYAVEYRMRTAGGEWKWILAVGRIVERDADGEPLRMLGTIADISARMQAEEELRQAQKIDTVGQLTAGIAHDMNNILTAIMGGISLAVSGLPDDDRETLDDLRDAYAAARRGAGLLERLMTFSRKEQLRFEVVDPDDVVEAAVRLMRPILPETISVEVAGGGDGARLTADPGALEQIVVNLIANARDAIAGDGTIRVSTAPVELEEIPPDARSHGSPGRHVRIRVADDGSGMDEEVRAKLFEPFFTTRGPGQGTGLGLAVVDRLLKEHRGIIEVASTPGEGSVFSVYLPVRDSDTESPPAREPEEAPAAGETVPVEGGRILLAEDDERVRSVAERILRKGGYEVRVATNGEEALKALMEDPDAVDLVLSDVVMPGMGGARLRERAIEEGYDGPFLFTSGYTPDEVLDRFGDDVDAASILAKPWTPDELLRLVRERLRHA